MLSDKIIVRARNLLTDYGQVCIKTSSIGRITFVHKPKCSKLQREMLDYFSAHRNFYHLDCSKQQCSKFLIKRIKVYDVRKVATYSKLVRNAICFKMSPITSKTKITDVV